LHSDGIDIAGGSPKLVACTGAISDQFFHTDGAKHGAPQWTPAMKRYDLVTFSFGGDDIQFKSTITQCTLALHLCAPANTERNKITELGSTGDYVLGIHEPGLPTFLNNVANKAVVKGGNVVLMGYPDVFENPDDWGPGVEACSDFLPPIVNRMRGWAGDLNATIGESVLKVDAEPASARNDVTFTFINPVNGGGVIASTDPSLFEPTSGNHHELCSSGGEPWVNGFSVHRAHSYHPNQEGENSMGALAAEVIKRLTWPWTQSLESTTCPTDAAVDNPTPAPPTEPVYGSVGGLGPLSIDGDDQQTALLVGPSGWPCHAVSSADADTTLTIQQPGSSLDSNSQVTEGLEAFVIPGGNELGQYLMTCALFPTSVSSALNLSADSGGVGYECGPEPPPGETDTSVGSAAVFFTDPPHVKGTWDNSTGSYPADGVVVYNPNTDGKQGLHTTQTAVCILPPAEQTLCTAALDDFAVRYGGISLPVHGTKTVLPVQPSSTPPAAPAATCPTPAQVLTAWQSSPGIDLVASGDTITGFTNVLCWNNWVLATPTDTLGGNGQFFFNTTGGLHGVTEDENNQLNAQLCATGATAPSAFTGAASCDTGSSGNTGNS
jgi:hypothetical protein